MDQESFLEEKGPRQAMESRQSDKVKQGVGWEAVDT